MAIRGDSGNLEGVPNSGRLESFARLALLVDEQVARGGVYLDAVRIKLPAAKYGETLVVLTATSENDSPVVGFVSGDSTFAALHKALQKWDDGSVQWREDGYRTGNR